MTAMADMETAEKNLYPAGLDTEWELKVLATTVSYVRRNCP